MTLARLCFLCSWILGISVTAGFGSDVVASSPLILGMLHHLGGKLLMGIVGLGKELVPKVCCSAFYFIEPVAINPGTAHPKLVALSP